MTTRFVLFFASLSLVSWTPRPSAAAEPRPRLLVLLTVDQGRGDYLDRFRPVLRGGLARLLDESVVFTDAHHFHAGTVTAAGHSSLSTGYYPAHSGMVGNEWYDRTEARRVYCVDDAEAPILPPAGARGSGSPGRSPARLLVEGLADWIQAESPSSLVYSIGAKDRAAILMGGKHADGAYWYDVRSGQWVTSRYYAREYPPWIAAFQRERADEAFFGKTWTPLPVDESLFSQMDITAEGGVFSHALGRAILFPDIRFYNALFNSPFIESDLFELARILVVERKLGQDEDVDVLALSFASTDTVGHAYGPNSRELLDTILRLDRELGAFFAFLDETVGLDHVAVSLSADHGVAPLPEYQAAKNLPGGRLGTEDFVCVQNAGRAFEKKFGNDDWFAAPFTLDSKTLSRRNVDRETVETALATALMQCPRIARVWTRSEIEKKTSGGSVDPTLELYRHSFRADRGPDLFVQYDEGYINRTRGTTHGSPYAYDTHVLALVRFPGIRPKSVGERIHTVDIPVTLASLLGVTPPEDVDGIDRSGLFEVRARR